MKLWQWGIFPHSAHNPDEEVFIISLVRKHLDWGEIVCCVFPCCGNTEDGYLLPPEILWVDRKLQSVPSSEVSLIGRALLLTTVCPGRHGHLAGRTVSGRSRGTSSSSTAPPRLLQLLLRLHWEDGGDCFSAGGLLITLSVWRWRNFGLQLQTSSFPGTTLSLPLQLMFNNFWAITSGLPRLTTSLVTDTLGGFVISPLSGSGLMGFIAALFVRRQWSFVSRVPLADVSKICVCDMTERELQIILISSDHCRSKAFNMSYIIKCTGTIWSWKC